MQSDVSTAGDQDRGRTVEELERELAEAHRREAATAEILSVISQSKADVQPVFDAIVTSCKRLLGAHTALVTRLDGRELKLAAFTPVSPEADEEIQRFYPRQLDERTAPAVIAVRERIPVVISDTETDGRLPQSGVEVARRRGYRSMLVVPMVCKGAAIGTINVTRPTPGPFSDNEIELLKTFADQAVIAIENTRLFEEVQARTGELTEALEQQIATSEVLNVISRSPGELKPVFETMLAKATELCEANFGLLFRCEGGTFYPTALHNAGEQLAAFIQQRGPFKPLRDGLLDHVLRTKDVFRTADETAEPNPTAPARLGGARSSVCVPMLKDNELVGAIVIYHQEVRPFTDKQIELVKNFASQAVIAIENARLLNELRESIQYSLPITIKVRPRAGVATYQD